MAKYVPSFRYTQYEDNWTGLIFCPLLMRHGSPPKGVKWYGEMKRLHLTTSEAKQWSNEIVRDCEEALEESDLLSHYKPNFRKMLARKIKNDFIRWCRDERKETVQHSASS